MPTGYGSEVSELIDIEAVRAVNSWARFQCR
nr:hypothetical protein RSP673_24170 [Ralstonia solanacearum P673]